MVGSAIALSISVGQFSDKPGQIHFRISRLESAFQRGLEPVYEGHQIANQIWIHGGLRCPQTEQRLFAHSQSLAASITYFQRADAVYLVR
jgi:hypothetical protein